MKRSLLLLLLLSACCRTSASPDQGPAPSASQLSFQSAPASSTSDNTAPNASNAGPSGSAPGWWAVAPSSSSTPAKPEFGVGAVALQTAIYERPSSSAKIVGYLRVGAIVEAESKPVENSDCPKGWYTIKPYGFVCANPNNATTDLENETLRAFSRRPDQQAPMPYLYGIARHPGPIYTKLPTREQAEAAEPGLSERIQTWISTEGENGASFRADYWLRGKPAPSIDQMLQQWGAQSSADVPWFLEGQKRPPADLINIGKDPTMLVMGQMKKHNGFALLDTMLFEGRRYALTTRGVLVPVDRLRPIVGSDFHGVEIPKDVQFPFAFIRTENAAAFRLEKDKFTKDHDLARRSVVKLTGKQKQVGPRLYYESTDGFWVHDGHASRLDPAKKMPKWGKKGERWIDINITKQTLVAYDGTQAVYATLVSTGEAGLGDPEKTKSTKRGIFRIHTKHIASTMDSDDVGEEFELQDIPYVQYFEDGYALHTAYWHDDFGRPRSHGCVNLAPRDARWLFHWTEPQLPPGWHSVRKSLTGSVVFVHP